MRRTVVAVIGAVLACALSACDGEPQSPTAGCTSESRSAGEPGAAEPLLVLGSARFQPTIVYADGAVVVPQAEEAAATALSVSTSVSVPMMAPGYHGDQPGGYVAGWLSECELDAITQAADEVFTDDVDFGVPQVTDMPSTEITYDGRSYSVYAFDRTRPAEYDTGLSESAKRARIELATLWNAVMDSTERTGALEIDRLFLHVLGPITDQDVEQWPLPETIEELVGDASCVAITDPEAVQALLDRLASDPPLLTDLGYPLAITAAAPGLPDCTE